MKFIPTKYERTASLALLKLKVNSPTLLFGAGIVAGVGTVVLACRATLKVEDEVFTPMETGFRDLKTLKSNGYSHKEIRHDRAVILIRGTSKMVSLYGPAFVLGVTSVACLTQSHRILTKRNVALTAAYSVLEKGFEDYRGRVRNELGEDKDREFRYGTETIEQVTIAKDGKEKRKKIKVAALGDSIYARFFNEDNPNWQTTPEYNVMFLRQVQNYVNDRLRSRGYISLNDVYKELGFEETTAGQVVGWVWKREDGDGYIDFGIFDENKADQFYDFVVGREGSILLDFNVDGNFVEWINKVNKSGWK